MPRPERLEIDISPLLQLLAPLTTVLSFELPSALVEAMLMLLTSLLIAIIACAFSGAFRLTSCICSQARISLCGSIEPTSLIISAASSALGISFPMVRLPSRLTESMFLNCFMSRERTSVSTCFPSRPWCVYGVGDKISYGWKTKLKTLLRSASRTI